MQAKKLKPNIQGKVESNVYLSIAIVFSLALEPCYTEDDIQYKIENIHGLTNLNADDDWNAIHNSSSVEDCRTYCRHKEHKGSQYRRDPIVQIFVFIGTPTQRQRTSLTIRATANATVSKITTWKRPDKIKVEGFLATCNVMIACNVIKQNLKIIQLISSLLPIARISGYPALLSFSNSFLPLNIKLLMWD